MLITMPASTTFINIITVFLWYQLLFTIFDESIHGISKLYSTVIKAPSLIFMTLTRLAMLLINPELPNGRLELIVIRIRKSLKNSLS